MKPNYPTNLTKSHYGANLRIIGDNCKRHIVTDTQGLLLGVNVHADNEHDSRSGLRVLERLKGRFERLKKIYADGGYIGELVDKVKCMLNCELEITLRSDKSKAFKPLPKRWVVERSFAWLDDFRRLQRIMNERLSARKV